MKRSEVTKQKILEAAEKAFSEKGLYGARVDEISELAGANKRMIYAYYGSKEKLYIAVLDAVYARMADSEKELLEQEVDCEEMIRRIIRHYFSFLYENPSFVKIVMWKNLNEAKYLQQSHARFIKETAFELMRKNLEYGVANGIFRSDLDTEEMILSINMFCFSYFSNLYTMTQIMQTDFGGRTEMDKRCEHVTEIILRYLKKEEK